MAAIAASSVILASAPVAAPAARSSSKAQRKASVCSAAPDSGRRAALIAFVAGVAATAAAVQPQDALALNRVYGQGEKASNGSIASSEGYDMSGTRKGGISVNDKKKLLAKVKAQAIKESAKEAPKPSKK